MTGSAREILVDLLLRSYPELKRRLARRLGSSELAGDALQDTYVRLRRTEFATEVRNPASYLYQMAVNIATNRVRGEARHQSAAQIETLVELPDGAPGPFRIAEGRSELAALERILDQMPARRRQIFRRAWVDGATHEAIAAEFRIAIRTVRHELRLATEHLHHATLEKAVADLQFRLSQVSSW